MRSKISQRLSNSCQHPAQSLETIIGSLLYWFQLWGRDSHWRTRIYAWPWVVWERKGAALEQQPSSCWRLEKEGHIHAFWDVLLEGKLPVNTPFNASLSLPFLSLCFSGSFPEETTYSQIKMCLCFAQTWNMSRHGLPNKKEKHGLENTTGGKSKQKQLEQKKIRSSGSLEANESHLAGKSTWLSLGGIVHVSGRMWVTDGGRWMCTYFANW